MLFTSHSLDTEINLLLVGSLIIKIEEFFFLLL